MSCMVQSPHPYNLVYAVIIWFLSKFLHEYNFCIILKDSGLISKSLGLHISEEDEISNYPQGLVLVPRGTDDNSVVAGPHIRGRRLRASAVGDEEVDLLLPGTARYDILILTCHDGVVPLLQCQKAKNRFLDRCLSGSRYLICINPARRNHRNRRKVG